MPLENGLMQRLALGHPISKLQWRAAEIRRSVWYAANLLIVYVIETNISIVYYPSTPRTIGPYYSS